MHFSLEQIIDEFNAWLSEAKAHPQITEPTAMNLATCVHNTPSNRMVLLKDASQQGFTFFTNYQGRKGRELLENPNASLCFYWMPLGKQVRIEGTVQQTDAATSDAYFQTRSLMSQIGAHASAQSEPLDAYETLITRAKELEAKFAGKPIPRPLHWGGFILTPKRIEFWIDGPNRLHKRYEYVRTASGWTKHWMNP